MTHALAPYSERMKKLLKDPDAYYTPKKRPSGHDIGKSFSQDNGLPFLRIFFNFQIPNQTPTIKKDVKQLESLDTRRDFPRNRLSFSLNFLPIQATWW
jgi:site-specific DNA-methyltransferase (cytosine-N4-specific)